MIWIYSNRVKIYYIAFFFLCISLVLSGAQIVYPSTNAEPYIIFFTTLAVALTTLPTIADFLNPKSLRHMNLKELLFLVENSKRDDWEIIYESRGDNIYIYRNDPSLLIQEGEVIVEDFIEGWANKFSDPKAQSFYVSIIFNGTKIKNIIMVGIDGYRATLPLPKNQQNLTVNKLSYNVAKIIQDEENFLNYFSRANFSIEE